MLLRTVGGRHITNNAPVMTALVEEDQEEEAEAEDKVSSSHDGRQREHVVSTSSSVSTPVMNGLTEVRLSGGPPWGFLFEGGSEFGCALVIAYIQPESVADRSGLLQVGDRIAGVGNTVTNNCHALTLELIRSTPPGHELTLLLRRAGTWTDLVIDVEQEKQQQQQQEKFSINSNFRDVDTAAPSDADDPVAKEQHVPLVKLAKSPSLTSLESNGSISSSSSSAASLPNNLLASSVSTLQRNCPARKSESAAMLSTLVRKLQDSLPRRNSERHHNHNHHHPPQPQNQQLITTSHQQNSPLTYNGQQQQQQQVDIQPNPTNHQNHPKLKKPLVSSFSFSLGRAPRPSGLSPQHNNGSGPVTVSTRSSPPERQVSLAGADGRQQVTSPVNGYPHLPMSYNVHMEPNGSASFDHSCNNAANTSLHCNEPHQSFTSLHLHQQQHQPPAYGQHRISASVVNLPASVSKSSSFVGNNWHLPHQNNANGTFAFENPLDADVTQKVHQKPMAPPPLPAPAPPQRPTMLHQFASCDHLNNGGNAANLLQPAPSSGHLYLSRGARMMPEKTSTINDTLMSLKSPTFEDEESLPERPDVSSASKLSTTKSTNNNYSYDSQSPRDGVNRVSWVSPTSSVSFPCSDAVPVNTNNNNSSNNNNNDGDQPSCNNNRLLSSSASSSAQFSNYARCAPTRQPATTSSGGSFSAKIGQTTVVRPQPSLSKPNFASSAVMVGRPPARISPQYGSNHQLYYGHTCNASGLSDQAQAEQTTNGRSTTNNSLNYSLSSVATRSAPTIGLLDIHRNPPSRPSWRTHQNHQWPTSGGTSELSSSSSSASNVDNPPSLPPRRYAMEEIRSYINSAASATAPIPEVGEAEKSSPTSPGNYADQLRLQSRSLIAATGGNKPQASSSSSSSSSLEKQPNRPFVRDLNSPAGQHPRQIALIAPLLSTAPPNAADSPVKVATTPEKDSRSSSRSSPEACNSSGESSKTTPTNNNNNTSKTMTPRKVSEAIDYSSTSGDDSIVSIQLPPPNMVLQSENETVPGAASISRFYRRLLVRANSDVASQSRVSISPSNDATRKEAASKSPSVRASADLSPTSKASSNISFYCDVDALATSSAKGTTVQLVEGANSPVRQDSPIVIDGCEQEDTDSAFAELSPGASHSSNSSSSGGTNRRNTASSGTSVRSSGGHSSNLETSSAATSANTKQENVVISLFSRQRTLLDDEVRCDSLIRWVLREVSDVDSCASILYLCSSSLGQYLSQVAAVNSTVASPLQKAWSFSSSEAWSDVLVDDDSATCNDMPNRDCDFQELLSSARSALVRKAATLKCELERIDTELGTVRAQRQALIDQQLAALLSDIDEETLDRLRSRLDELEMGALLAVRVASRAARLSPMNTGQSAGSRNSTCSSGDGVPSRGKSVGSNREWRAAVEKLDDVRDVIDSLRQRITGALGSKMLLTAITDSDLNEIATFVNTFGQLLFDYHEVNELVQIAEQQLEAFTTLHQNALSSLAQSQNQTKAPTASGSVTVVVD